MWRKRLLVDIADSASLAHLPQQSARPIGPATRPHSQMREQTSAASQNWQN